MPGLLAIGVAALLGALGAAPAATPAAEDHVVWGGVGIRVDAGPQSVVFDLDAARGVVEGALVLDSEGRFDATGTVVRERPGPTRRGATPAAEPARFRGRISGDTLTLDVTLPASKTSFGPLEARRGATARVRKMY